MKDFIENIPTIEVDPEWDGSEYYQTWEQDVTYQEYLARVEITVDAKLSVMAATHLSPSESETTFEAYVRVLEVWFGDHALSYTAYEEEWDKLSIEITRNVQLS